MTPLGYYLLVFALLGIVLLVGVTSFSGTSSTTSGGSFSPNFLIIILGLIALAFVFMRRRR